MPTTDDDEYLVLPDDGAENEVSDEKRRSTRIFTESLEKVLPRLRDWLDKMFRHSSLLPSGGTLQHVNLETWGNPFRGTL